jgi:hypothetical protein
MQPTSKGRLWDTIQYASCYFGIGLSQVLTCIDKQVHGKAGGKLNYDELVIYTDHAIRPAYLVMYELVSN